MIAIVDAGPLYAAADRGDADHEACAELLRRADIDLVVPALVIAETAHFIGQRLDVRTEVLFLRSLEQMRIEAPTPADLSRMAELVERYADFPLGSTDASIVALAERLNVDALITLDRRHFGAARPRHRDSFALLP
ncbi:MAG: PIN domain-containing protein [Chloroflexota bacterium]